MTEALPYVAAQPVADVPTVEARLLSDLGANGQLAGPRAFTLPIPSLVAILTATCAVLAGVGGDVALPIAQHMNGEAGLSTKDVETLILQILAAFWEIISFIILTIEFHNLGASLKVIWSTLGFLYAVITFIEILESLAGVGSPNEGKELSDGVSIFSVDIVKILDNADPSPATWSSPAAAVYEAKNALLKQHVDDLTAVDGKIAQTVARQAKQVETLRLELAGCRMALVGCFGWKAWDLATPPGAALDLSYNQIVEASETLYTYVHIAIFPVVSVIGHLIDQANHNRRVIKNEQRKYRDLIDRVASMSASSAAVRLPSGSASIAAQFIEGADRPVGAVTEPGVAGLWRGERVPGRNSTDVHGVPAFILPPRSTLSSVGSTARPVPRRASGTPNEEQANRPADRPQPLASHDSEDQLGPFADADGVPLVDTDADTDAGAVRVVNAG